MAAAPRAVQGCSNMSSLPVLLVSCGESPVMWGVVGKWWGVVAEW
jgi:hypothetical protein